MDQNSLLLWLLEDDETSLAYLWKKADEIRKEFVGPEVHLRGLVEISNYCVRQCEYCGINAGNLHVTRYRLTEQDILSAAHKASEFGYGTIVMQSGEDFSIEAEWLATVIQRIKRETPLAVTLSLGERTLDELKAWKYAGADRYLLRFETSNSSLFYRIHPSDKRLTLRNENHRIGLVASIRELGYEAGSGIMVGIPGQTYQSLVDDLNAFDRLNLDMIGIGPYIPHPNTPLGMQFHDAAMQPDHPIEKRLEQVPATDIMCFKLIALARILCPYANIPSTTALGTLGADSSRKLGLERGANVVMPNLTPQPYRSYYEIYPNKSGSLWTAEESFKQATLMLEELGRPIGKGMGGRKNR